MTLASLGNAEAYFEALLSRRESSQIGYRQLSLDYARGSPLIPAGLRRVPNLQRAPTLLTYGQPLQIRAFIGFGNDQQRADIDYTKVLGGLSGDLPLGRLEVRRRRHLLEVRRRATCSRRG